MSRPVCICKCCAREFVPKEANRLTYCSRACFFEYKSRHRQERLPRTQPTYKRACAWCRGEFESPYPTKRCCSSGCEGERIRQRQLARYHEKGIKRRRYTLERPRRYAKHTKQCAECGVSFMALARQAYCTSVCAGRFKKRDREARQRAAYVAPVSIAMLVERDGRNCGICGLPVTLSAIVPNPLAPTIDHVIPLARGGEHSPRNTQLAHFACNSGKGARVA